MSGPFRPDLRSEDDDLATEQNAAALESAKEFVLQTINLSPRSIALGELVRKGAINDHHFSSASVRSAIAQLENEGLIQLTADLHVRACKSSQP
jgi:hypothetical protein